MNARPVTASSGLAGPALVAALLAVDSAGLGGVAVRSRASPQRDAWLTLLRKILPAELPMRRIPLHADDSRLLGGLDLPATLRAGRPVAQSGLLAQTDGGLAILPSAERMSQATVARMTRVLDCGEVAMERNGLSLRSPARLGLVALDEGADEDERLSAALLDRLAFQISFEAELVERDDVGPVAIHAARLLLPQVVAPDTVVQALCASALVLGISSPRAPLLALRAARAAAAIEGRTEVGSADASLAASLVLAPRATRLPEAPAEEQEASPVQEDTTEEQDPQRSSVSPASLPDTPPEPQTASEEPATLSTPHTQELEDQILHAAQAAIPAGLLATLHLGQARSTRAASTGSGAQHNNTARGRPTGARRGELGAGARLNLIETLRAAAPWQRLRKQQATQTAARQPGAKLSPSPSRIQVRREDFHVSRFKQRRTTTTIFVVDASGSSALHRLAEAKGAVELLLADCYVRRDQVAVLAFRGKSCELLLPPTRSLVRAKRSMAVLPGGGGTPLAAGLDMARDLALACNRRGETPILVLLTDARANIARDGSPGREAAVRDALASARSVRTASLSALLIDTSPRAQAAARQLADTMGATYLPLPHAGAGMLSQAVRGAGAAAPVKR